MMKKMMNMKMNEALAWIREKTESLLGRERADLLSGWFRKGGEDRTSVIATTAVAVAISLFIFILRLAVEDTFSFSLLAFAVLLGFFRPRLDAKVFKTMLGAAVLILAIVIIDDTYVDTFPAIAWTALLYLSGEVLRYIGLTLGGFISERKAAVSGNPDAALAEGGDKSFLGRHWKPILAAVAAVAVVAILLNTGSGGGGGWGLDSLGTEETDSGRGSASGTYSWSNGPLYMTITISGDRWYSSSNTDMLSGGRIRNKTLYDDSGAVSVGRIINSKTITYSGTTLHKE